mmetsp:Transcript_7249/g.14307  ORF Transcript_7249/g.14307 Transcript_7249/m.14307 type:complete len:115 (-) Transcript_7249:143-487(-)
MEPFFKPISLTCGHKFCKPCMEGLVSSSSPGLSPGQVWSVLRRSMQLTVQCPCCRSSASVGPGMPVLGSLCMRKFPEEFKTRAREADKDFDRLFEVAWKEAGKGCTPAGACSVM